MLKQAFVSSVYTYVMCLLFALCVWAAIYGFWQIQHIHNDQELVHVQDNWLPVLNTDTSTIRVINARTLSVQRANRRWNGKTVIIQGTVIEQKDCVVYLHGYRAGFIQNTDREQPILCVFRSATPIRSGDTIMIKGMVRFADTLSVVDCQLYDGTWAEAMSNPVYERWNFDGKTMRIAPAKPISTPTTHAFLGV